MPSDIRWIGNAQAVADVGTITPATVAIGNIFTVTINGKNVSFTATAGTVANVCTGLVAALQASTAPAEFTELTWTDSTTKIDFVGLTAGVPVILTSSAAVGTGGGAPTNVRAYTTTATGPNFADNVANYSTGALPVNGDNLYFGQNAIPLLYNLAALTGVTLALLEVDMSFTGTIGSPQTSPLGYYDYRARSLALNATLLRIGTGVGQGSSLIDLDLQAAAFTATVINTGSGSPGAEALRIKGTHAANVLSVGGGTVGVASYNGELSTLATLDISGGSVRCTSGVTLGTVQGPGGELVCSPSAAVTAINSTGLRVTMYGGAALTTLTVTNGGIVTYLSTGAVTNVTVGSQGVIDRSGEMQGVTFTNTTLNAGGSINDPSRVITYTNKIARGTDVSRMQAA